jgi:hypothetical protein
MAQAAVSVKPTALGFVCECMSKVKRVKLLDVLFLHEYHTSRTYKAYRSMFANCGEVRIVKSFFAVRPAVLLLSVSLLVARVEHLSHQRSILRNGPMQREILTSAQWSILCR